MSTSDAATEPLPADMPHVEGVRHRFVTARGVRFHVAECGVESAPPVVMLHGWPQHWYEWRDCFAPLAAAGMRPIAIDLRGFGWSDRTPSGYRKWDLAEDVLAVLDELGIERFRLVGHDWGGFVAFLLGRERPDRVERLVLTNTGHGYAPRDLAMVKAQRGFWYMPLIGAPRLGPWLVRSGQVRRVMKAFAKKTGTWSDRDLDIFMNKLDPNTTQKIYGEFIYGGELAAMARPGGRRSEGKRFKTPTLFLYGDRDVAIKPAMVRGMEEHADDYRLEVLHGLDHFLIEQAPDVVVPKIVNFLTARDEQAVPT